MDNWLVFETVTYTHKVTAETEEEAIKIVKGGGQGQDKTVNGVEFSAAYRLHHPLRPATDRCLGELLPHQLANQTRAHPQAKFISPLGIWGISGRFQPLSPS